MSKRDRKALVHYIRHVADQMQLRDWTVTLEREPCDEERIGQARCVDGQRHVFISVAANFTDYDAEEQRETIVHELVHAHHEWCWRMVQSDLAEPLGKVAYYVFCDAYRRAMELAVDGLSKAIAPHMPLIDWPKR